MLGLMFLGSFLGCTMCFVSVFAFGVCLRKRREKKLFKALKGGNR